MADDHTKALSWPGWAKTSTNDRNFGLELQSPFAGYVLNGSKSIETRAYALPPDLISSDGKQVKIDILESEKGQAGVSGIPNKVPLLHDNGPTTHPKLKRTGWCTFTESFRYTSREQFEADADKHLVDASSGYGWSEDRPMYGWVVGSHQAYALDDSSHQEYTIAERRMRSLFELHRKSTILITGASGMLGRALHRHLLEVSGSNYNVIGTGHTRLEVDHYPKYFTSRSGNSSDVPNSKTVQLYQLDLLDFNATTEFLQKHCPDIIVHCAAERYPDAFETKLEDSIKLNVESTRHLSRECQRLAESTAGSKRRPYLVYISTSYVFDGGAVSKIYPPYTPQSKANPINNYGKSKWEGECAVRDILNNPATKEGRGVIVRVPLLYGEDCFDLSESPALEMMKIFQPTAAASAAKKKIDHWALRFPTSVEDLSRVLKLIIDKALGSDFPAGTYHIASPHGTTKYELMQLQAKLLNISSSLVEERTEGNSGGPPKNSAPRPQCTQLDCSETWKVLAFGSDNQFEFVSLEEGMKRALNGFPERFVKE